jgi:DNA-binding GntR family transcriptional regulator
VWDLPPLSFRGVASWTVRSNAPRIIRTLTSDLFDRIRLDILHARLQAASRLLFRDLHTMYGSGQSPLRDALKRWWQTGKISRSFIHRDTS